MPHAFIKLSRSWGRIFSIALVGLAGCAGGGRLGDDCSSNDDCDTSDYRCVECSVRNTCYFDGFTDVDDDVWACEKYGAGTAVRAGSGSSSGGSSSGSKTGACAYTDPKLHRILCGQTSASGCSGKFFGSGVSCAGLSCSTSSPSSCTVSGGPSPGGGGNASGGCVGTNEMCNSQTVSGCTMTFCAGGPGGCYYVAGGERFSCNGDDIATCGFEAGKHCSGD